MEQELYDTLWLTLCGVLVLLMQAGFLCFESGATRSKNAINVAMKNAADFTVAVLVFWLLGFGLMFGDSFGGWVGLSQWAPDLGQGVPWQAAFFVFQTMFCATAVTIVSGTVAERLRFNSYLLISLLVVALIYPVAGHWAWGGLLFEQETWLNSQGFVDFAGSTVVHSVGGWVALAALLITGPRLGRFVDGKPVDLPASNAPLACMGILFFVVGWIGFNGGSTLALNSHVPGIIANTLLAAMAGACSAYLFGRYAPVFYHDPLMTPLNGCLAGLVGITASAHAVSSMDAVIIGSTAAFIMIVVDSWMLSKQLDDAIGAIPVHLGAGVWGTIAVAIFGDPDLLNTGLSIGEQLLAQLTGIVAIGLWSFTIAYIAIHLINRISPLRVTAEEEKDGLNVSEHGARTDLIDLLHAMDKQQSAADINHRVPAEPFTEVGQVAERYNRVMDALADSIRQTQTIVRDIRDAIFTFGDDGRLTSFNPGAEKVFGIPAEQAIGQSLESFFHQNKNNRRALLETIELDKTREYIGKRNQRDAFYVEVTVSRGHVNGASQYTALCRDINDKRKIEEQLFREQEQALVTLSSIADGVITTDHTGKIVYLNDAAESLTGWTRQQAIGQPFDKVYRLKSGIEESRKLVRKALAGNTVLSNNHDATLLNLTGQDYSIAHTAAPIKNRKGRVFGSVVVFHDVTTTRAMQEQLSYQATHDALTGLLNRTGYEAAANKLIEQSIKERQFHILGYLDLDQFKLVNDTCGHSAGDELLRQVVEEIKANLRSDDTIARLGGDEFGILLRSCSRDDGIRVAEGIREAIQDYRFSWHGRQFAIGVSIGLVQISPDSPGLAKLLSLADTACYAAKDQGRNRVHFYEPGDAEMAERRGQMQWVPRIRQALDKDQLRLFYQTIAPIDDLSPDSGHYEIFVRMIDDDGATIPPGAFIPAAERYNLIQEIDLWVIKNALAWVGDHNARNPSELELCALNISGASIGDATCRKEIIDYLDHYGVPGEKICFEVTETAAITNLESARKFIHALKRKGCKFALDDFGSGLSSFGYLKNLPVDYLKIDGAFIRDIHNNSVDSVMVQSINTIGHEMGLKTIAEFVESEAHVDHLRRINIDYVQGYHIGKPQPLEQLQGVVFMPR